MAAPARPPPDMAMRSFWWEFVAAMFLLLLLLRLDLGLFRTLTCFELDRLTRVLNFD